MTDKRYEIVDETMYLIDPEVGCKIVSPFLLPCIPKEIKEGEKVRDSILTITRDISGNIKEIFLKKEGKLHGQKRSFYEDGTLRSEMYYNEDLLQGPSSFYSKESILLSRSWFYEGKKEGIVFQNYLSGKLYSLQGFREGLREKKHQYFYENKSIKTILHYKNGFLDGEVILFWLSGVVKRRCFFENGKKEGKDELFNEKGRLIDESIYKKNKPLQVRKWDDQGNLIEEYFY